MNKIIIIAVHPDDETLGCGGTILKHKAGGDSINWLIVTSIKEDGGISRNAIEARRREIEKVSSIYGFDDVFELNLPTTRLDELPMKTLIGGISDVFKKVEPNILYLPFKGDVHTDHKITFQAAYASTKGFRYPWIRKIIMMETLSETEFAPSTLSDVFSPNMFVDITDFIGRKIEIMNVYKNEFGKHPFPRSARNISALATLRGATAGCEYAEGFVILKEIN